MGSRSVGKSSLAIQFAQVRLTGAVACLEGDLLQTPRYALQSISVKITKQYKYFVSLL